MPKIYADTEKLHIGCISIEKNLKYVNCENITIINLDKIIVVQDAISKKYVFLLGKEGVVTNIAYENYDSNDEEGCTILKYWLKQNNIKLYNKDNFVEAFENYMVEHENQ